MPIRIYRLINSLKYILKNHCKIKYIIDIPSYIFTNTSSYNNSKFWEFEPHIETIITNLINLLQQGISTCLLMKLELSLNMLFLVLVKKSR